MQSRRARLWLLLIACGAPLILLKYQVLLGIDALQKSGALPLDFGALAVPLGISYLTFKCIMYLLQVARGAIAPVGLDALSAYLAFAPAATSGPIDRPDALLQQIAAPARLDFDRVIYAVYRIAVGVIFKFVLADTLREFADALTPAMIAVSLKKQLLYGPYYSLWLYFDFAGYSHIAIGAAYLLGIKSMENFAAPLLRPNITRVLAHVAHLADGLLAQLHLPARGLPLGAGAGAAARGLRRHGADVCHLRAVARRRVELYCVGAVPRSAAGAAPGVPAQHEESRRCSSACAASAGCARRPGR